MNPTTHNYGIAAAAPAAAAGTLPPSTNEQREETTQEYFVFTHAVHPEVILEDFPRDVLKDIPKHILEQRAKKPLGWVSTLLTAHKITTRPIILPRYLCSAPKILWKLYERMYAHRKLDQETLARRVENVLTSVFPCYNWNEMDGEKLYGFMFHLLARYKNVQISEVKDYDLNRLTSEHFNKSNYIKTPYKQDRHYANHLSVEKTHSFRPPTSVKLNTFIQAFNINPTPYQEYLDSPIAEIVLIKTVERNGPYKIQREENHHNQNFFIAALTPEQLLFNYVMS